MLTLIHESARVHPRGFMAMFYKKRFYTFVKNIDVLGDSRSIFQFVQKG